MKRPSHIKVNHLINIEGTPVVVTYITDVGIVYNHPFKGKCSRRWDSLAQLHRWGFIFTKPTNMKTKTKNETQTQTQTKRHIIYEDALAGVKYSDYQRVAGIRAGRKLALFHERSNKFDPFAIKVTLDGVHIGYIGKNQTGVFHAQHKLGNKIHAEIVSYNRNNPTWDMIIIRAWVDKEIPADVEL